MPKIVTKSYETVFIVDSLFEEDKVESIIQKYSDLLTKEGCSIVKVDKWGRRKLSYAIKKKNSGYYVTIEFHGPTNVIAKLERAYHIDDNIIRFLNVSFDKKTYELRKAYQIKREEIEEARRAENAENLFTEEEEAAAETEITTEAEIPAGEINQETAEPEKEDQQEQS
jgi:small subunit ribosomal protein S6